MKATAPENLYFNECDKIILDIYSTKEFDDAVEYVRTDVFIDKARKWFEMQNEGVDSNGNYKCDMTDWECFKSYMKGGKV